MANECHQRHDCVSYPFGCPSTGRMIRKRLGTGKYLPVCWLSFRVVNYRKTEYLRSLRGKK